ncbi:unnamed protein product [Caretta caretta]
MPLSIYAAPDFITVREILKSTKMIKNLMKEDQCQDTNPSSSKYCRLCQHNL